MAKGGSKFNFKKMSQNLSKAAAEEKAGKGKGLFKKGGKSGSKTGASKGNMAPPFMKKGT